jgi:NADH-quinone oxidoreductase subunit G
VSGEQRQRVTIVVDGAEIEAPEGEMLVDAAKSGDVEIPVFCYEPKLGDPVGACRMCLVEIEGIPKLQTSCSTPIRDGMVVYTQTDRVKEAQNAVVEFLLINHPLDCPVCDKGGECPLQDIAMGWGDGHSRMTDPKRHFQKPIPLSPLIKIDRERCILCYRCVRFSQEVSEDEQLQLLERGPKSFVGTFNDRPYVAPFHGNIIELCPVGALTSQSYRFRARPWDIEDAGSICTLCPSQCNVKFTVRDEQVARVLSRDNENVDDGWLCDKGRFGYQMLASSDRPTEPRIREGGALRQAGWEEALERTARGLTEAHGKVAAIVGGGSSNEEAYLLQRMVRGSLGSADITGTRGAAPSPPTRRALDDPRLSVGTASLDRADAILVVGTDPMHEMPILELRIRKAVRRYGASLLVAGERPTALDGGAAIGSSGCLEAARYEPGQAAEFLEGLADELGSGGGGNGFAAALSGAEDVVIVWGERVATGPGGERGAAALLRIAAALELADRPDSGLYEIPEFANGRGIRESGAGEGTGPGLGPASKGRSAAEIRAALEAGDLEALILWDVDPVRDFDEPEAWSRAIGAASFTLSVSMFGSSSAQGADVQLPAESHAEKEGTVTHPDGRLQRVRPSVSHPGAVRPLWQALCDLSTKLGDETGAGTAEEVFELLAAESPLYAGITYDAIGGTGVRWQDAVRGAGSGAVGEGPADVRRQERGSPSEGGTEPAHRVSSGPSPTAPPSAGSLLLGTYRDLWADFVSERNPSLEFLRPSQTVEISESTAKRLGVGNGTAVLVTGDNGKSLRAHVAIRHRTPDEVAFLIEGTAENGANLLSGAATVEIAEPPPEPEEEPTFGTAEREKIEW